MELLQPRKCLPDSYDDHSIFLTRFQLLMGYTNTYSDWEKLIGTDFSKCTYTNCMTLNYNETLLERADMLFFHHVFFKGFPSVSPTVRTKQYWVITTTESAAYPYNKWRAIYDDHFNITATHRSDSVLYTPLNRWFPTSKKPTPTINYTAHKTKGAVAIVSNCDSRGYARLKTMQAIKKYIPVDIYGNCGTKINCPRTDNSCVNNLLSEYRFYLSFENSLCEGYTTEKFWKRILSPAHIVPVAMGGLSMDEYTAAPPNSFLHVYNFTSIKALGEYLQLLLKDDQLYNSYHRWRETYDFNYEGPVGNWNACELCHLANEKPFLPALPNVAAWWNDRKACRSYSET